MCRDAPGGTTCANVATEWELHTEAFVLISLVCSLALAAEGPETVVTGTRTPRTLDDAPVETIVIPRTEIERSPTLLTDELLRGEAVTQTFRRSSSLTADPTSQGLSLRGIGPSGVSRATLLLDGVPMNDGYGGWVYWRALPRLGLDQIEIVPGAASAQYGSGALGGVVQLLSRKIDRFSLDATGLVGTQETVEGAARVCGASGPVGASFEVEAVRSSGFPIVASWQRGPIDRDAPSTHVTVNGRVEANVSQTAQLFVTTGYFSESQNAGTPLSGSNVRLGHLVLGANWEAGGHWQGRVFGRLEEFDQTRSRVSEGRVEEELVSTQHIPIDDSGLSLSWASERVKALGTHVVSAGIDGRFVGGQGRRQQLLGLFVQEAWRWVPAVEVLGAVRLDGWENEGRTAGAVSPKLVLHLRPHEAVQLRLAGYRAFRAPTLNELYRPFQVGTVVTQANPLLDPETLWGGDAGAEVQVASAVSVRVTGFGNRLDSPIVNRTLPDGSRMRMNLGAARIVGLESGLDVRFLHELQLSGSYVLTDARVVEGDEALVGKQLSQDPAHRFVASLSFSKPEWFTAMVQVRVLGESFEDDRNTLKIPAVTLCDASLSRVLVHGFEVFAAAQNLFGAVYVVGRAGVDTVGPPFSVRAGLRLRSARW